MLIHGCCPITMLSGTMVPIPNIQGTTNSDNFRDITMSNIFIQLFDLVVLDKCEGLLNTSSHQFGFKKMRNLCGLVIRLLLFMYLNQLLDVRWNHQKSNSLLVRI